VRQSTFTVGGVQSRQLLTKTELKIELLWCSDTASSCMCERCRIVEEGMFCWELTQ